MVSFSPRSLLWLSTVCIRIFIVLTEIPRLLLYDERFILLVIPGRITHNYVDNPPTLKFFGYPAFRGNFFHDVVCALRD